MVRRAGRRIFSARHIDHGFEPFQEAGERTKMFDITAEAACFTSQAARQSRY